MKTIYIPRVLVLLATYNGEIWLQEQLDSILSQEGVDVRVLVCDDVSTDDTLKMLCDGWRNDLRVKVSVQDNSSGSAGANFRRLYVKADLADIDFVALADQDDIWMPHKLISAVKSLNRTDACGYSSAVQAFWPNGRERTLIQNNQIRSADLFFEGAGQGCTFVLTVIFFRRIQSFCEQSSEAVASLHYHDWLIYLLSRAWGGKWYFDKNTSMRYRQHGGNEIGARGGLGAIMRRLGMIRNGWYVNQVKAAINLYKLAGGQDSKPLRIGRLINSDLSPIRNIKLMMLLFMHSRRGFGDRCVLSVAALIGWL